MNDRVFASVIEASEETKFFEYGEIRLDTVDNIKRYAILDVCMPQNLFQVVTPALLGSGLIDDFRLRDPIAVWLPKIGKERLSPMASTMDSPDVRINQMLKERVEEVMRLFQGIGALLNNPGDLVPLLPMGTYITFKYRCEMDKIPNLLEHVQKYVNLIVGVAEFQWAIACVLAQALAEHEIWVSRTRR